MKKKLEANSPEFRDLVGKLANTKLTIPSLPSLPKIPMTSISETTILHPISSSSTSTMTKNDIKMESMSKDILSTIAMNLDLPSLLRWCQSNSEINNHICNNSNVWRNKLLKDYPDYESFGLNRSLKETYVFMYQLSLIKNLLNSDESLYDIFQKSEIDRIKN